MDETYDLIILGAGPAGVGAAVYAARARLHTLWIDRSFEVGGQMTDTSEIDNYPGIPGVGGVELAKRMAEHAQKLGMVPKRDSIRRVEKTEDGVLLRSKKMEYRAKTLILSGGAVHRRLDIPGEEKLTGAGVSYCAACDGAFFKDQTVIVVGGGNTAVEDAIFLSRICKWVYLVHRRDTLRADQVLQLRLKECENVEILWSQIPVEVQGEEAVTGLLIKSARSGIQQIVDANGIFVAVGTVPATAAYEGLVELDPNGYIVAGEDGKTSTPGIFAAGDIRTKRLRQIVTAVADGANAVTSVLEYLEQKNSVEKDT